MFDAPVTLRPGLGLTVYAIGDLAGGTFDLLVVSQSGLDLDAEFVDLAYAHVLGRDADADGQAYWLGLLADGTIDRHEMLLYFADSAELKIYTATN